MFIYFIIFYVSNSYQLTIYLSTYLGEGSDGTRTSLSDERRSLVIERKIDCFNIDDDDTAAAAAAS